MKPHNIRRGRRAARHLTLVEREEISRGMLMERSLHQIAATLGRAPSTIAREVRANGGRHAYRACSSPPPFALST